MMRITRKDEAGATEIFIAEGLYEGEMTAKIQLPFWGEVVVSQALLNVMLVKKPESGNKFDATVFVNQTFVASSYFSMLGSYLPDPTFNTNAEITVDYATSKITAKRVGYFYFGTETTNIFDIAAEADGSITTNSSLGQFSIFAKVKKIPVRDDVLDMSCELKPGPF